jgi:hypothetical protein
MAVQTTIIWANGKGKVSKEDKRWAEAQLKAQKNTKKNAPLTSK